MQTDRPLGLVRNYLLQRPTAQHLSEWRASLVYFHLTDNLLKPVAYARSCFARTQHANLGPRPNVRTEKYSTRNITGRLLLCTCHIVSGGTTICESCIGKEVDAVVADFNVVFKYLV
jgi:hypothetical protein